MAVSAPILGTPSGANGAALTVALPIGMGITTDDIVVMYAVFYANSGTVPTAIDWTSGLTGAPATWTWTQGELVDIKNASGVVKGVAGWAWARATGAFNGSCGTISANGTSGANSGSMMNSVRVRGCINTGDPYEDKDFLNPNFTTTIDWPACDMSRSTGGMSLILFCLSDNLNIGTPANWTAVGSNASTQGLDSGVDSDYRIPGATGTYDPANGSIAAGNALGWATFHIMFTDTAGGPTTHFGASSMAMTFGKAVSGIKTTFSSLTMPITFGAVTNGRRTALGQLSMPITFGKAVSGQRTALGQLSMPIAFGKAVSGHKTTFGQLSSSTIFGKSVSGHKTTFGQLSLPISIGINTSGIRSTYGSLSLPITFQKTVNGHKTTFGSLSLPITMSMFVDGIIWTGPATHFGSISMPITFGKDVGGHKTTFGQVVSPFIFSVTSDGQRRTFSALQLPIIFDANVESGRVTAHGSVELELIFGMSTSGIIKLPSVVLNEAVALYLGEQQITAVYVGGEQVWP